MAAVKRGTEQPRDHRTATSRERANGRRGGAADPASAIETSLARHSRVGVDTICFIYHLSRHPVYAPVTATLFSMIESGRLTAVTSSLALIEILGRPKQLGDQTAADSYKIALATFPHLELRRSDIPIIEQAADLRARYRLGTPEAIQLATAIIDGADAFIGNDGRLRAVREIEVLLLDELRQVSISSGARA